MYKYTNVYLCISYKVIKKPHKETFFVLINISFSLKKSINILKIECIYRCPTDIF